MLCYQYGGESKSGLEAVGSPANWRCTALEKFSRVKLLEDVWRTAPNHSRPASCVIDADIDADGWNLGVNAGRAAGQTVEHAHVHLIPRRAGDVADPRGGVRWVLPDRAAYWW